MLHTQRAVISTFVPYRIGFRDQRLPRVAQRMKPPFFDQAVGFQVDALLLQPMLPADSDLVSARQHLGDDEAADLRSLVQDDVDIQPIGEPISITPLWSA